MRRSRFAVCVVAVAGLTLVTTPSLGRVPAPRSAGAVSGYVPPLAGRLEVVRPFDPPTTVYGAGHRGVDLRGTARVVVRAAAAGVVLFAGAVAGRGVVVLLHPDGIRTEYEPVRPVVRVDVHVAAGQPIGVLTGRHRGCPGVCLHWGARRGDTYLDPLRLLAPLGPVVLLPWLRRPDG
jgi:murein DD-endopeptidase MepM/ murein hydrolase activator NlpD